MKLFFPSVPDPIKTRLIYYLYNASLWSTFSRIKPFKKFETFLEFRGREVRMRKNSLPSAEVYSKLQTGADKNGRRDVHARKGW